VKFKAANICDRKTRRKIQTKNQENIYWLKSELDLNTVSIGESFQSLVDQCTDFQVRVWLAKTLT